MFKGDVVHLFYILMLTSIEKNIHLIKLTLIIMIINFFFQRDIITFKQQLQHFIPFFSNSEFISPYFAQRKLHEYSHVD